MGNLLKVLRDHPWSKIVCLHPLENRGFCDFLGLGLDFGIVSLAISQSLMINVGDLHQDRVEEKPPNIGL